MMNDYFYIKDFEYRTERVRRAIRSRDGSRARAAWLRRHGEPDRIR